MITSEVKASRQSRASSREKVPEWATKTTPTPKATIDHNNTSKFTTEVVAETITDHISVAIDTNTLLTRNTHRTVGTLAMTVEAVEDVALVAPTTLTTNKYTMTAAVTRSKPNLNTSQKLQQTKEPVKDIKTRRLIKTSVKATTTTMDLAKKTQPLDSNSSTQPDSSSGVSRIKVRKQAEGQ